MTRILSLVCGLALAAPAAAQERPAQPPRPTPPTRPGAEGGRDLQAEVERLRAQVRELEARLARERDGDRRPEAGPKGPPDGRRPDAPKADDRRPTPREVAPAPRPKGEDRGPAPKADGPAGGRGFGPPAGGGAGSFGPGGGGFGKGGFGPGGFPQFGGMKDGGPKGPPFGPGGFKPPAAAGRGAAGPGGPPADLEQRLNRIIDDLERLRDDLHRGPRR